MHHSLMVMAVPSQAINPRFVPVWKGIEISCWKDLAKYVLKHKLAIEVFATIKYGPHPMHTHLAQAIYYEDKLTVIEMAINKVFENEVPEKTITELNRLMVKPAMISDVGLLEDYEAALAEHTRANGDSKGMLPMNLQQIQLFLYLAKKFACTKLNRMFTNEFEYIFL